MTLLASFAHEDTAVSAAAALREKGVEHFELFSPIPLHHADAAVGLGKSPVRVFTLLGAVLGAVGGFALCVWTATRFLLPTAGRPIIALPPYLLITYETTILLGVLATLLGFFVVGLAKRCGRRGAGPRRLGCALPGAGIRQKARRGKGLRGCRHLRVRRAVRAGRA